MVYQNNIFNSTSIPTSIYFHVCRICILAQNRHFLQIMMIFVSEFFGISILFFNWKSHVLMGLKYYDKWNVRKRKKILYVITYIGI